MDTVLQRNGIQEAVQGDVQWACGNARGAEVCLHDAAWRRQTAACGLHRLLLRRHRNGV